MKRAYKLQGVIRNYDWGGTQFISELLGTKNEKQTPQAEYWMGAHPSAPAMVAYENEQVPLPDLIHTNTPLFLGSKTQANFNSLPYLFKVLDVASMLSIQVHPSIDSAIKGFDLEEAAGIPIHAAVRNYKDKNHKPEVMVALSDFWLLHGFLAPHLLETRLKEYTYFHSLLDHFNGGDYQGLYQYFMQLNDETADCILRPLMNDAVSSVKNGLVDKLHPHWWANKYYQGKVPTENIDKGIFSIYILNIVFASKYQGVFQGAGLLHAYLEGQNIELMANSDNVLRGGLTPKHVDIGELLQHVHFVPTYPAVLAGDAINEFESIYPCPVPDFGLSKIAISTGNAYTILGESLQMLLVMEGELQINNDLYKRGEVALVLPEIAVELKASEDCVVFKSYVP
jgi:mannose-6-phosphate isomerase